MFAFLHSIGVYTRCIDGYYYPISMQASAVVWALLDRIKALQVTTYLSETVTDIRVKKDGYHIQCNTEIIARKVILACGGRSYPSLGGCAEGARLAEKLGVKQEPQRPALCAVMTEENTEAVKGVRVACSAWFEEGNTEWKQSGELQITEYGLSGIMIFNLSSELGRILSEKSSVKLYVDFLPEIEENAFVQGSRDVNRSLYGYLNAYLPDKLAMYILETACEQPKQALIELTEAQLHKIYHLCRRFPFHVRALKNYEQAQVTAGGIRLTEIQPETMECLGHPGMYATGEMLDIDGDCGGYNLTFALLTGLRAGRACHDKN